MRQLILLRHAKSSWDNPHQRDFDRPLNGRGQRAAPRMGRWLLDMDLVPGLLLCSPARRTRQTAAALREAMPALPLEFHESIYEARREDLLKVLGGAGPATRVLLLGHNPGLDELLGYLCHSLSVEQTHLPTAAAAVLELPDDWRSLPAGCATLLHYQRPRALRNL